MDQEKITKTGMCFERKEYEVERRDMIFQIKSEASIKCGM